jgi:hypothetical protein
MSGLDMKKFEEMMVRARAPPVRHRPDRERSPPRSIVRSVRGRDPLAPSSDRGVR